jgi:hypothetical protein
MKNKDLFQEGDLIYWKNWELIETRIYGKRYPSLYRIVAIDDKYYYHEDIDGGSSGFTEKRYCEKKHLKVPLIKKILLYDEKKETKKEKEDFIRYLQRDTENLAFQP